MGDDSGTYDGCGRAAHLVGIGFNTKLRYVGQAVVERALVPEAVFRAANAAMTGLDGEAGAAVPHDGGAGVVGGSQNGGSASGGDLNLVGGDSHGASAWFDSPGSTGRIGTNGGASFWGGGGLGGYDGYANGPFAGRAYGSGGGGQAGNASSGAGANGVILIEY